MNKFKTIRGSALLLMVVLTAVLFQNCSGGGFSTGNTNSSSNADNTDVETDFGVVPTVPSDTSEFTYPHASSAFTLKPGDVLTIKILKPAGVSHGSTYWRVAQDYYALAAYYGPVIEKDGYIYISFTVSPYFVGTRQLSFYLLKLSDDSAVVSNDTGFKFTVDSTTTASHGVSDTVSALCSVASQYAPALSMDRSVTEIREALLIGDNGGGVGGASCVFTKGTDTKTVNCLNTSEWPVDWRTWSVNVSARSRCGATTTRDFTP